MGVGWYDYVLGDCKVKLLLFVDEMVVVYLKECGVEWCKIGDDEIVEWFVFVFVNEGVKIFEEKIVLKVFDIDMVYLIGYGFLLWCGGLMLYVDMVGFYNVECVICCYVVVLNGDVW